MRTNEEIIEVIDSLRKEKGLSLSELARRVGMAKSALSRYFNKTRQFPLNKVQEFANVLDVSSEFILGFDVENKQNHISTIYEKLDQPRQAKVYSFAEKQLEEQNNNIVEFPKNLVTGRSTAAGDPINGDLEDGNAYTMIVDKLEIPKSADEIVTIAGDSMEPTYEQGSQVFISWQSEVEQGEVAVVAIQDEGVTCKKVYYDWEEGEIILRSINEKYKDRIFSMDEIRIIGKVVM